MRLTDLLRDVGRPVAYYPSLAKLTGGVTHALLLCQFLYWAEKGNAPDGSIYKTQDEITTETGLSRREQEGARRALRALGLLTEHYSRLDHKMYYRVNQDALNDLWEATFPNVQNRHSGQAGTAIRDRLEPPFVHTEITTETTSERGSEKETPTRLGTKGAPPSVPQPDWYKTLRSIPGFVRAFEEAEEWRVSKGISEERAETTAYALKGKWTTKRWTDPWATFQNWVKMPPLNGGRDGRPGRYSEENHVGTVYEARVDAAGEPLLGH